MKRSDSVLLILAAIPFLGLCCAYSGWKVMQPEIGSAPTTDNAPIKGLPNGARNIRYYIPGAFDPCLAYEFDTTEAEFESWVAALPPPKLTLSKFRTIMCIDASGKEVRGRELENGPVYEWLYQDQHHLAAYDRSLGRAFYYSASR
jgi:hypothetical protein